LNKETPLTLKQFHWCFTNALSRDDSDAVYNRYYIPGSARPFFQAGLANFNPKAVTKVDYRTPARPPLLIATGTEERISPPAVRTCVAANCSGRCAMRMPHRADRQVIKRRLVGKEGAERTRELRAILTELPNYENGPYADLRKWVQSQLEETRARSRVVYRDSIEVQREGAAQIAFVGPPNAGKSSLLQSLSN